MVRFGGSDFINCQVPLVFEGRYFILEPADPPLVSVILEYNGKLIFEVKQNEPNVNPITEVTKTPPGIITVSDRKSSRFIYKIRPDSETTVAFGRIDGEEISVRITDTHIHVGTNTIENVTFNGVGAGVVVNPNGGFALGAPIPPILLEWFKIRS
jgi:hypothetical protein